MMFRRRLAENRQRSIHPLPSQLFAAEDFDRALPDRFGTGMLKLVGLLGKPRNRGTARRAHDSSVAQNPSRAGQPFNSLTNSFTERPASRMIVLSVPFGMSLAKCIGIVSARRSNAR